MSRPHIAYVGLTHLGLCSAVAAAERGFEVTGFDPDARRISALERGETDLVEPRLSELLKKNPARLRFSAKPADLSRADLVFVAADVPTDDAGVSDLSSIERLLAGIRPAVSPAATLVILSQVPPGFTRAHAQGGRPLYYQVETLIFGRAIERASQPERIIVGCLDPAAELPPAYRAFLESFGCPILPMRFESAELAKISINICLAASISVSNTLAEICERIGADWSEIVPALRLDARIGKHAYLTPGLGIAGGNLERDLCSVIRIAEQVGGEAGVIRALQRNSAYRAGWALRVLHHEVLHKLDEPRIAILGLAYKADTAATKNSPALALIRSLQPFRLALFDPAVSPEGIEHPRARSASTALEACEGANALAIMTPWAEFRALDPAAIGRALRGSCVIDPYGTLDAEACARAGLEVFSLGSARFDSKIMGGENAGASED